MINKIKIPMTLLALAVPGADMLAAQQTSCGPLSCATLAKVDAAAKEFVTSGRAPAVSVAIVAGDSLVFSKAYGKADLEQNVDATPLTVFPVFSMTKTFTAAAVMQLVERGIVKLDDPLSKFIPDFPRGAEVTVRQLLNQTTGIADYARPGIPEERMTLSSQEIEALIKRNNPMFLFDPGTRWQYSNANYALLGRIIEIATGQSWAEYVALNVFSKAHMPRTAVDRNVDVVPWRASGYMQDREKPGAFINGIYIDIGFPYAAGSIRSTAVDMARWYTALFGNKVVSSESLELMMTPGRLTDNRLAGDVVHDAEPGSFGYYGFGLNVERRGTKQRFAHGGAFPSFSSITTVYPDDRITIAVLANTGVVAAYVEDAIAELILK